MCLPNSHLVHWATYHPTNCYLSQQNSSFLTPLSLAFVPVRASGLAEARAQEAGSTGVDIPPEMQRKTK